MRLIDKANMRQWRNWQTRKIQVLMGETPVEVQVLSAAPKTGDYFSGFFMLEKNISCYNWGIPVGDVSLTAFRQEQRNKVLKGHNKELVRLLFPKLSFNFCKKKSSLLAGRGEIELTKAEYYYVVPKFDLIYILFYSFSWYFLGHP